MSAKKLPALAKCLVNSSLPIISDINTLKRSVIQNSYERAVLIDFHKSGLPNIKDDKEIRNGILAYVLGFYADAEDMLLGNKKALARLVLGMTYADIEEYKDAEKEMKAAVKGIPDAALELSKMYIEMGDTEKAMATIEKTPVSADLYYNQGLIYQKEGKLEKAMNAFESAIEQDANHILSYFQLGNIFDRMGDDEMSIENYVRCSDSWPVFVPGIVNLGIMYEERGEANAAIDCFRQALSFNPKNERALLLLRDSMASRSMYYEENEERERQKMKKIIKTSVNDFELSVRSRNCLTKMNIFTLGDLISISESEMLNYKNFGETSLQEVKEMLRKRGLRLGMLREKQEKTLATADPKTLSEPIERLELSNRTMAMLAEIGVTKIGDLEKYNDLELYRCDGSGQTIVQEISTAMGAIGFKIETAKLG